LIDLLLMLGLLAAFGCAVGYIYACARVTEEAAP